MNKQLGVVMILLMTIFIGFGIIIPVLPDAITGSGAGSFHLGLLLSVYSLASFLMSPFWGALSDRVGRRPLIMTGAFGFSLSFFLFGIAGDNLVLMYLSRILGGLFSGAATACAVAYVADITTEENRTKGMGAVGMSIGLGFIFGPAFGGLLSGFGTEVPFFAASALAFATFIFAFFMLPESLTEDKRRKPQEPKVSRWKAFDGPLKYLYVLSFFVSFSLAGLEATLLLFQRDKIGADAQQLGIMFAVSGIVGALIQGGVVRRLIKRGQESMVIGIGLVLSAIGFVLILFSTSLLTASIYLSVFAAGNALIRPCVTSLITQKTKVGQGVASGLSSSMDSLGRITGPLLGAGVYDYSHSLPFYSGALMSAAAVFLLFRFVAADRIEGGRLRQTA
ncbi:MFS transporter [Paenibacillus mucilaginosus]|uniref:Major facilitator superfamily protein n=3 Tax=Paenibacillus mucilaginosus TaxID=61624 RepID=H6NB67_9BACL|nr:tetracycline resistance MFS efflux pump [Paenibacillus mucilaginosus]AEI42493.1 major facilitator superfamily MFS_1 [Paenibacillus mucilaginosus KNP414]AFC32035.1 major facilitator superfamily protein [Paenibacillus mucilaginosus 3016]AFH64405.1 MFS transporter [Paenibacillus mucilaginosus K02]MCG7213887.1 tetracycline resistance MFS efflux pump [Paenibacillus mucilaginosus]WDM25893.1 tetracycline resistance MFS efflux pump [Paenibacillus mucilaginosus]